MFNEQDFLYRYDLFRNNLNLPHYFVKPLTQIHLAHAHPSRAALAQEKARRIDNGGLRVKAVPNRHSDGIFDQPIDYLLAAVIATDPEDRDGLL